MSYRKRLKPSSLQAAQLVLHTHQHLCFVSQYNMLARASLRPGLGCQRNIGSCSSQGRLLCAVVAPQPVSSVRARLQTQTSRWRCSSATDSSRPVPSEEPSPPSDTPEAQTALPASTSEDTAVAEKRRKGIVLLEELKELVKGSNAELKVRSGAGGKHRVA